MKYRFTIAELEQYSDRRLLVCILTERLSTLNSNTPLYKRLNELRSKVEDKNEHLQLENFVNVLSGR